MKTKKKLGLILAPLAVIAICISLIAGATFALFTGGDEVDVTVTSGSVSITAEVVPGECRSTLGDKTALGGFNTKKGLAIENIAPGDVYSFTVKAQNNSSISVQHRTTIELTNELLASALEVKVDGVVYSGLTKYTTKWEETDGAIDDIEVELAFPVSKESQNKFQNLRTDIKVIVEGVQGNAPVSDEDRQLVFSVNNGAQLEQVVNTAKELEEIATVNLVDDVVLTHELYVNKHTADLTLNGNGHEITAAEEYTNVSGKYQLVKINTPDHLVTLNDVTLRHVAIEEQKDSYHALDVWGSKVELNNVTLIRDFASVKGGAALVINGAEVVATDLHVVAGGSAWGGINVDGKNGAAKLTLKSGFGAAVENGVAVWCENGGTVVDEEGVLSYTEQNYYKTTVLDAGTEEQFVAATFDVPDNGVINLTGDFTVSTATAIQAKNVTLNGNGHKITLDMSLDAQGIVLGPDKFSAGKATVKDLTIDGKANYGLFIANYNGEEDVSVVENVTVTGQYKYASVCFPNNTNAVVKNCSFENNLPDSEAMYYEYGIGSMGVFCSYWGAITLDNTTVDTWFINNPQANHTKLYLTNNSVVNCLFAEGDHSFSYAVDESSAVNYYVLCKADSLPQVISGENAGEYIDWNVVHGK